MTLSVDIGHRAGTFDLTAKFESGGRVTALFGRSGAGKTTLVNLVAGLLRPARGRIAVDGAVLFDATAGIDVPTRRRQIGYVFQEGRLFPHYTVRGNLLYGAGHAGRAALAEIADLLGIAALLDRRPATLSGGEKQRVAIGRALLAEPRILLMDEPLASLDEARRAEILPYIERLRDEMRLPIVYVSHDMDEVARLADTLVLLSAGRVVASGPVNDVLARLDLAEETGRAEMSVVLVGRVASFDAASGTASLDHPAGRLSVPMQAARPGEEVRLRIRARDVALAVGETGLISIRNRLAGTVTGIAAGPPPTVNVRLDIGGSPLLAAITREAADALGLAVGRPVTALVKSAALERPPNRAA
ncbi:MAG TPA: molybdenum ABC transporter ATP-binding protein [Bauldia sp.]|nr:molybdenum ABC transporter ATP-binding protein [Bauldia sp.]